MRTWTKIDNWHIKNGLWTITKADTKDLPKPYCLWFRSNNMGYFATSAEAKEHAKFLEATQA